MPVLIVLICIVFSNKSRIHANTRKYRHNTDSIYQYVFSYLAIYGDIFVQYILIHTNTHLKQTNTYNLSNYVSKWNGGGHPNACGVPNIKNEELQDVLVEMVEYLNEQIT